MNFNLKFSERNPANNNRHNNIGNNRVIPRVNSKPNNTVIPNFKISNNIFRINQTTLPTNPSNPSNPSNHIIPAIKTNIDDIADKSIHKIKIFSSDYTRFTGETFRDYFIERNIETDLYNSYITNKVIDECANDKNLFLFIITPMSLIKKQDHNTGEPLKPLPQGKYIMFQTEQYNQPSITRIPDILIENCYAIYDYSRVNLKYYRTDLRSRVKLITPLIKEPDIENDGIKTSLEKSIDILLIGTLNNRRLRILNWLKRHNDINRLGYNIKIVTDKFGDELVQLIKMSKIVINLHFYPRCILEVFRIHDLLHYNCRIISEVPENSEEMQLINKYMSVVNFIPVIDNRLTNIRYLFNSITDILKDNNSKFDLKLDFIDKNNAEVKTTLAKSIKCYKYLFHKYYLGLTIPDSVINYDIKQIILLNNRQSNGYYAHLHCYDLSRFTEIYGNNIEQIKQYFNVIVTYSIGDTLTNDNNISNNIIILKIPNRGMDIGAKFCVIDYLRSESLDYKYVLFLHSKTNPVTREKYFKPLITWLDDAFFETIENYDGYFPDIQWEISGNQFKTISGNEEYNNIQLPERNILYRVELLKYLSCKYPGAINSSCRFIEGNCYILSKNVIDKLFGDRMLYNILNHETSFDYNWVKRIYNLNGSIEDIYQTFLQRKLAPRNDSSYDGYVEHVFERVILNCCDKYSILQPRNIINIVGFKTLNVSISDNLFLLEQYIEDNPERFSTSNKNSETNKRKDLIIKTYDISEIKLIDYTESTIICLQPFELRGIEGWLSRFTIKLSVLWVWEFKSLPPIFKQYEKYFNKVYVPSEFCRNVFQAHLMIPVEKIDLRSRIHKYLDQVPEHEIKNQNVNDIIERVAGKTVYGYCFDLNSSIIRKNPLNLVKAFNRVCNDELENKYKDCNNIALILKYRLPRTPGNVFVNSVEREIYQQFLQEVNKNANIHTIEDELDTLDIYKLYTRFDYYISPHAGEGYGFTIYDNMTLGNRIISPYYSGETEYLDNDDIIPLDYIEEEIPGLRQHPVYGLMRVFKGANISVESIVKGINTTVSNSIDNNNYILYFVHLTCTQDFNTGIQKIVRTLSVELNKKKKVILIKFNKVKCDYEVINDDELKIFIKYGGINHYNDGYNFNNLSFIFNNIKYKTNNFVIPELYYCNQYAIYNMFFQKARDRNYNISHIYYDDTIYYHIDLDKSIREFWFNEYIKTLSIADNIIPISFYSEKTYKYHKNRLGLNSSQNIYTIQLGVVDSVEKLEINNKINFNSNLIISNISNTERKNYKNLIEAFKLLRNLHAEFKLVIFGNGWDNKYDTENNIEYKSFVSDEEKNLLYENCLFSVYPSLKEGYGIPIYESLMLDKCVICHNETSTLEIANNIDLPCVSAVDCTDINCLFEEIKKFCNKEYLVNLQKSIRGVKFKTYQKYSNELYNLIYDINDINDINDTEQIYFCESVLNNNDFSQRGVGCFVREIKKTIKNITNIYHENCKNVVFTHPPPMKNNKNILEEKTFNLLNKISITDHHKKVITIYDIIPHIFKEHYKPESDYYKYFELAKKFDIIICISESTKNDLHTYFGFNLNKIIVIYPELDKNLLKFKDEEIDIIKKYNITKKYIIAPLGADFRKNNEKTIKSFVEWNNNNYQLVLMYNCPESYKNYLLKDIPINHHENIIFTGYVPDDDYKNLIKNAELTFFISLYEGFGYCVMESTYLGTPVLTSNISSTNELGLLSPNEIILCDPNNIEDIVKKLEYLVLNIKNYDCSKKILYKKCYDINNNSFINRIDLKNSIHNNITISDKFNQVYERCLKFTKYKNKVKNYNIHLDNNLYNLCLNLFDLNIQIRITNGGGGSGCVTDSCFLNKYILTNNDLNSNAVTKDYQNIIIANTIKEKDWNPILTGEDMGGYSLNDIDNIVIKIKNNLENIKSYKDGVNTELAKRLLEYPIKLINFLGLNFNSRICFVTPYGSDKSGISDFSYTTIKEISNYFKYIDIYTDAEKIDYDIQNRNLNFFKIDEIHNNKDNYDEIIWVIGNSSFHDKMIKNGVKYGGTFLIHDESLFELYSYNRWVPKHLSDIHPFTLRDKGNNINYEYLCFHEITNNINNKFIVHNQILENIMKKNYNVRNITILEYPNFNLNIFDKLTSQEELYYKNLFKINSKSLNILLIGGVSDIKLPNYAFKLLDKLNDSGIDTELFLFYNK